MDDFDNQEDSDRGDNNKEGLGGNLVQEGNVLSEGEEQFQQNDQIATDTLPPKTVDDNSFNVGQYIENIQNNENFSKKEKEISEKIDQIFRTKTGKSFEDFSGYFFMANKLLLLTTFSEFLFQRFDIVGLFLNIVIIFIESGIFNKKHMYKWLLVLIGSLVLDALVLLDISPAGQTYLESGAGSTMLKFGLLIILVNVFLKLFLGIGIWKMAMENKNSLGLGVKSSLKYEEEHIEEGDPTILRGQNRRNSSNEEEEE